MLPRFTYLRSLFTVSALVFAGISDLHAGLVYNISDGGSGRSRIRLTGSLELPDVDWSEFSILGRYNYFSADSDPQLVSLGSGQGGAGRRRVLRYRGHRTNPILRVSRDSGEGYEIHRVISVGNVVPRDSLQDMELELVRYDFRIFIYDSWGEDLRSGPLVFDSDFLIPVEFSSFVPGVSYFGTATDLTAVTFIIGNATAVPEPTTFAMCGLGAIGLVASGIRRKRRAV